MKIKIVLQRHSVFLFFFLTFLISWGGSFLGVGPKFLRDEPIELSDIGIMGFAMLAGPFIAGIVMTYLTEGRGGLRDLFSRMTKWRIGKRWYTTLLIFPILVLSVSFILSASVSTEFFPIFFGPGLLLGILAGFFEETGWMGFAFPKMRQMNSVLGVSLILGLVHGVWHLLAGFFGQFQELGQYWIPYNIGFVVFVWALRVLIVWVYVNTESLLLSQLMHASSSGFLSLLVPTEIAPQNWVIYYLVYAIVMWIIAVVIILKFGKNLKT
jgi:membrane protease YdiL (CAAX protease family)